MSGLVLQAKAARKANDNFKKLTKPKRPPLPGTATPAAYVVNQKKPPAGALWWEKGRDALLLVGTHWIVAVILVIWLISLVVVFVIFCGSLLYVFDWGEGPLPDWPCTSNSTCCTCIEGYMYGLYEDYWQQKMAHALSILFTYSVLVATPWRISILVQLFDKRCSANEGVDFYGR